MTIKVSTFVGGEVVETTEYEFFDEYAESVYLKIQLHAMYHDMNVKDEEQDSLIESLAEAKKRGGVH